MNNIARVDQTKTNAAGNWGFNRAVIEIHFGAVDLALIELDRAFLLENGSLLHVQLLLGNRILGISLFVAAQVYIRLVEQGRVAVIGAFSLGKQRLIGPGIELRQNVALMDHLALAIVYGHKLAIDPAVEGHHIKRRHIPQRIHINAYVARCSAGNSDRHGQRWPRPLPASSRLPGALATRRRLTLKEEKAAAA